MNAKHKQSGLTLIEVTVVIVTAALLISLGLPALRAFLDSFQSQGSVTGMISSALASARTIAVRNQRYAGIRFQKAYHPEGPLKAPQYMIFIVQDPDMMAYGFRAVPGLKPIKLPETIEVMDLTIVTDRNVVNPANPHQQIRLDDPSLSDAQREGLINEPRELTDTTTFSVIFSPSGKLVIHGVRVRNRNGATDDSSKDDVFNTKNNVDAGIGMFYQDDYFGFGLGPEPSRNSFVIYNTREFKRAYDKGRAWSEYLVKLVPEAFYINPYTGTIISPPQ